MCDCKRVPYRHHCAVNHNRQHLYTSTYMKILNFCPSKAERQKNRTQLFRIASLDQRRSAQHNRLIKVSTKNTRIPHNTKAGTEKTGWRIICVACCFILFIRSCCCCFHYAIGRSPYDRVLSLLFFWHNVNPDGPKIL